MDFDAKKIKITSLQRDTLIWIPEPYNDYDKLNHAHWRGGPELAVKMLNYNFDLDITQYVGFSFEALETLVDLVDGIDITLPDGPVSYTHLDVYKRQGLSSSASFSCVFFQQIVDHGFFRIDIDRFVIGQRRCV